MAHVSVGFQALWTLNRFVYQRYQLSLMKQARDETSLDIKRTDFKLDMVAPHLFMNFRIVDEHGRQLGQGRNLGALKAEWGSKARGAFQALASLKIAASAGKNGISACFNLESV